MKVSGSGGRGDSGVVGEEAGIALVSIHSDYPRYTEERTGLVCKVPISYSLPSNYITVDIIMLTIASSS